MATWGAGLRFRVVIGGVFCTLLGLIVLTQNDQQNSTLAHSLRFGWTPYMVAWVLFIVGVLILIATLVESIPCAAIMTGASAAVFVMVTVSVWPVLGHSYWFPAFTGYAAINQAASLYFLARDWGTT